MKRPVVKIVRRPGGKFPERKTDGAAGADIFAYAIVDMTQMDHQDPNFRKTIFDFRYPPGDPRLWRHVVKLDAADTDYDPAHPFGWILKSGESAFISSGTRFEMLPPMCCLVIQRSGLASKGIEARLAIIDSDYRGEMGAQVYNRSAAPFVITFGLRMAQVLFLNAQFPELQECDELSESGRGAGGFGSTGLK